jgi:hypothetical protein
MSNIKDMMASKYPSYTLDKKPIIKDKTKKLSKTKSMKERLTTKSSEYNNKSLSNNTKLLIVSLLLAVLFMMLSLPKLYKYTGGKIINSNLNYDNFTHLYNMKMPILHSILFFFISFAILKFSI